MAAHSPVHPAATPAPWGSPHKPPSSRCRAMLRAAARCLGGAPHFHLPPISITPISITPSPSPLSPSPPFPSPPFSSPHLHLPHLHRPPLRLPSPQALPRSPAAPGGSRAAAGRTHHADLRADQQVRHAPDPTTAVATTPGGCGRGRPLPSRPAAAPAPPAGKDAAAAQIPPRRGAPRGAPEVARVVQETVRVLQGS